MSPIATFWSNLSTFVPKVHLYYLKQSTLILLISIFLVIVSLIFGTYSQSGTSFSRDTMIAYVFAAWHFPNNNKEPIIIMIRDFIPRMSKMDLTRMWSFLHPKMDYFASFPRMAKLWRARKWDLTPKIPMTLLFWWARAILIGLFTLKVNGLFWLAAERQHAKRSTFFMSMKVQNKLPNCNVFQLVKAASRTNLLTAWPRGWPGIIVQCCD